MKIYHLLISFGFIINRINGCQDLEPKFTNSNIRIILEKSTNIVKYSIVRGTTKIQSIYLDSVFLNGVIKQGGNGNTIQIHGQDNQTITFTLKFHNEENNEMLLHISRQLTGNQISINCMDLEIGHLNWYGGPQNKLQYWPIEKAQFTDYSYVTKEQDNCGIAERYWLNSNGIFVYIEPEVPLFIEQNSLNFENQLCFKVKKSLPYDIYNNEFVFNYYIGIGENSKMAHLLAINQLLGKPIGYPDERMVRYPIWSTWALYKAEVNDSIVREFAKEIIDNQFENSQIEIDDDWENCYGALTFRKQKFPNITKLTNDLKELGFRITLWIHPFINTNCTEIYNEAKTNGYLVLDHNQNDKTKWWNSKDKEAAYIDFTNTKAVDWYLKRLEILRTEQGIDSFKFDAGESSWTPLDPLLNSTNNLTPNILTSAYVRAVTTFGDMIEVRSGFQTQDLPIFLRMIDKDTNWNWNNGLPTIITTLLQLNMVGYSFILPDMIGGNGYNNTIPDKEIFIRWTQTNVFMPSLQFSYVPWQYDQETIEICIKFTKLHYQITDYIMERFELVSKTGEPVNPPLWWLDPTDQIANQIYDQFCLGDKYIIAPVIVQNQIERDIYLPKGKWIDGNTNQSYIGPKWLMRYPAPLSILPYFIRSDSDNS